MFSCFITLNLMENLWKRLIGVQWIAEKEKNSVNRLVLTKYSSKTSYVLFSTGTPCTPLSQGNDLEASECSVSETDRDNQYKKHTKKWKYYLNLFVCKFKVFYFIKRIYMYKYFCCISWFCSFLYSFCLYIFGFGWSYFVGCCC